MELIVTVGAGSSDREICPVRTAVPELKPGMGARLAEAESGKEIDCQVGQGELAFMLESLPKGEVRRYRLVIGGAPRTEGSDVDVQDRLGEALDISIGGTLFTRYNYAATWHRPFFHPVIGPGGQRVTRSWPMEEGYEGVNESHDHPHHQGIWVAHGEVNEVNNWGSGPGSGRIIHREFESITSGPIFAEVQERLDWTSAEAVKVLSERRRCTIYHLPGEERMLDLGVTLTATEGPVTFGDTKEAGLLSVRVASSMEGKRGNGLIENGFGGVREKETWGKPAPWCHYSGPVGDVGEGIACFDHPSNPRFPTNWHVRDYGLMSANCFGYHDYFPGTTRDGSLTLEHGDTVTFRYRVFLHRGDAAAGKIAARWADFAAPPTVGVEE